MVHQSHVSTFTAQVCTRGAPVQIRCICIFSRNGLLDVHITPCGSSKSVQVIFVKKYLRKEIFCGDSNLKKNSLSFFLTVPFGSIQDPL